MKKLSITKINENNDTYLYIFERYNNKFLDLFIRNYLIFTKFYRDVFASYRKVETRYYLIKLVKQIGLSNEFKYCFSHSGKTSSVIFTSSKESFGLDIEPVRRQVSTSLRSKLRYLYPNLLLSELLILMIYESLVKILNINKGLKLSGIIFGETPVQILPLTKNKYQVVVNQVNFYAKIYRMDKFYVCLTRQKNIFPRCL